MNDRLVEILTQRPDFNITGEDKKRLDFFAEYLDHGSLFMVGFEPGEDPVFVFTNDAQRYRFSMSDIRKHVTGMKSGTPMPWEQIEYELINRQAE
ncbi:MAG TPA: hypothetical protein VFH43_12635 [Candidatus Kapabacteria bacterium]|nr:hypothetical protein [Candidatus Kapabacteria bacterium]